MPAILERKPVNRIRRGRLSIPMDLPDETAFTVERIGDTLVVFPTAKISPALKAMLAFRREADAAGVSLPELLAGLEAEGERYTRQEYGAA